MILHLKFRREVGSGSIMIIYGSRGLRTLCRGSRVYSEVSEDTLYVGRRGILRFKSGRQKEGWL